MLVCTFGIAVNWVRSRNDEVDLFDVSASCELSETITTYKNKGVPILIEARRRYRT